jgi:hypothetical protein
MYVGLARTTVVLSQVESLICSIDFIRHCRPLFMDSWRRIAVVRFCPDEFYNVGTGVCTSVLDITEMQGPNVLAPHQ